MKKLTVLIGICEDEAIHRKILKSYLNKILDKSSYRIAEFSSGEQLLENYPNSIDILLLDVQMKDINGLETARKIRKFDTNVNIIFITAIIDFIQQGYEVKAYRYLLKPIKYEIFCKNILTCIEEIHENYKNYLTFKDANSFEIVRVPVNSILYIETESRFVQIHTDKMIYKYSSTLNKLEKQLLNENFYRCHRSYLININKVKRIKQNTVIIKEHEILVSRYKMKNLKLKITSSLGEIL